jgi:hypothetical protein
MLAFAGSGEAADTERPPRKWKKLLAIAVTAATKSKALQKT